MEVGEIWKEISLAVHFIDFRVDCMNFIAVELRKNKVTRFKSLILCKCVTNCQLCVVLCLLISCGTQLVGRGSDVKNKSERSFICVGQSWSWTFSFVIIWSSFFFLSLDLVWPSFQYKNRCRISFCSSVFLGSFCSTVVSGYVGEMRPQAVRWVCHSPSI